MGRYVCQAWRYNGIGHFQVKHLTFEIDLKFVKSIVQIHVSDLLGSQSQPEICQVYSSPVEKQRSVKDESYYIVFWKQFP